MVVRSAGARIIPILMSLAAATIDVACGLAATFKRAPTIRHTTNVQIAAITKALRRMINNLRFIQISCLRLYVPALPSAFGACPTQKQTAGVSAELGVHLVRLQMRMNDDEV